MKNTIFTGSGVALITPMNADGSVNYDKLAEILDEQINGGTDAIITCGTTGESATMSIEEHVEVVKFTINYVNHRIPVIAGSGSNDTAVALQLSKEAEALGADGLLMVTPYYNKTSQRGLIAHFTHIADNVNIPIILYNVPSRTGCCIQPETAAELAKHKNIVAIKEASGDISAVAKLRALCGDELDIYSGNDDQITPIMSLGGKGVISVLANVAPKLAHDIAMLAYEGNYKESARLQTEYLDLINALFIDVNPIPVKAAMNMMGKNVGECRLPLYPLSDSHSAALKASLEKHGMIK